MKKDVMRGSPKPLSILLACLLALMLVFVVSGGMSAAVSLIGSMDAGLIVMVAIAAIVTVYVSAKLLQSRSRIAGVDPLTLMVGYPRKLLLEMVTSLRLFTGTTRERIATGSIMKFVSWTPGSAHTAHGSKATSAAASVISKVRFSVFVKYTSLLAAFVFIVAVIVAMPGSTLTALVTALPFMAMALAIAVLFAGLVKTLEFAAGKSVPTIMYSIIAGIVSSTRATIAHLQSSIDGLTLTLTPNNISAIAATKSAALVQPSAFKTVGGQLA